MPYKDPGKRREYRRRWYKNNKDSEKIHVARRKKELRRWFQEFKKELECSKCGENHPATIDFHHRGEKENEISYMVANGHSKEKILKEIEKCGVLCANCRRKLHYKNL
ncbi:hypothetical protein HN747_01185 [archaeon]|nr:hypothetical protein [archaeon]